MARSFFPAGENVELVLLKNEHIEKKESDRNRESSRNRESNRDEESNEKPVKPDRLYRVAVVSTGSAEKPGKQWKWLFRSEPFGDPIHTDIWRKLLNILAAKLWDITDSTNAFDESKTFQLSHGKIWMGDAMLSQPRNKPPHHPASTETTKTDRNDSFASQHKAANVPNPLRSQPSSSSLRHQVSY